MYRLRRLPAANFLNTAVGRRGGGRVLEAGKAAGETSHVIGFCGLL
jgi:hypothetical protein